MLTVPTFLASPTNIARLDHWRALYDRGLFYTRPIALVGAVSYLATAYTHYHPELPGRAAKLVAAGLLTISITPFTLAAMGGVNKELRDRDDHAHDIEGDVGDERAAEREAHGPDEEVEQAAEIGVKGKAKGRAERRKRSRTIHETETTDLLRQWQRLNFVRAMLPLLATIVAFDAL